MPTFREIYFKYKKQGIEPSIIYFALQEFGNFDYFDLIQHFDDEMINLPDFKQAMSRYQNGEMIEYIFNKAYFLSLPFYVDKNVLIPRQETEQLVLSTIDRIGKIFDERPLVIADVCTGSGAIGLSLSHHLPNNKYYLSDIDKGALNVAKKNAHDLNIDAEFLLGDMLEPYLKKNIKVDVIVCNPPYIEDISTIDKKTWEQEPHLALLANPCTYFYEKTLQNFHKTANEKYLLAFEIGQDMEQSLTELVKLYCPNAKFEFENDLYDKTRFLFIYNK